ncbi:NAD-dependent epimerase/dehydratase family protein [Desulfovibrio sp. OttesenSCG-928-G11]|nr:NAD-dependent epimerase/dehydratase family protein [Desulfovibrio sp. OttesenSCG-928-G11]
MKTCVFVTGASGFLGRHVARELTARGKRVVGLGRAAMASFADWGLDSYVRCPVELATLETAAESHGVPEALFHCAGSGSVSASIESPHEDFQNNALTTAAVLEFSRRHNNAVAVILPSSAAVYGNQTEQPLREDMPPAPFSPYGVHKKLSEDLAGMYGRCFAVPSVCIRFFSLYGPTLRKQLLWDACRKATAGDHVFFGTGRELRDWLHVMDAARLMYMALEHASPSVPIVNGASGHPLSVQAVLRTLGSCFTPPWQPVFSLAERAGDPAHLTADITLSSAWGFCPAISVEQGLHEYASWFRALPRPEVF